MTPVPLPRDDLAPRRLALRAIMDGRGADAVVLSRPRSLAHYAGPGAAREGLLVVTAREALLLLAGDWAGAGRLLRAGCALGHDGAPAEALAALGAGRLLCLSAEIARQIEGWPSQAPAGQTAGARSGGPGRVRGAAGQQKVSRGGG